MRHRKFLLFMAALSIATSAAHAQSITPHISSERPPNEAPPPPDPSMDQVVPVGWNEATPPPMDNPASDWFLYRKDALGRITYLSYQCLYARSRTWIFNCWKREVGEHFALLSEHAAQEKRNEDVARDGAEKQRLADEDVKRHEEWAASPEGHAQLVVLALSRYEGEISFDHATILHLQGMMADERSAGRISGYVDARNLHDDGLAIQYHERSLQSTYVAYRTAGGRKTLQQIFATSAPHRRPVYSN